MLSSLTRNFPKLPINEKSKVLLLLTTTRGSELIAGRRANKETKSWTGGRIWEIEPKAPLSRTHINRISCLPHDIHTQTASHTNIILKNFARLRGEKTYRRRFSRSLRNFARGARVGECCKQTKAAGRRAKLISRSQNANFPFDAHGEKSDTPWQTKTEREWQRERKCEPAPVSCVVFNGN